MATARLKSDATTLVLTNRHQVFWPEHGYTKGDLFDYYCDIAPVIRGDDGPGDNPRSAAFRCRVIGQ